MRGPHNIWRLIRTGATLERTGAMPVLLDAVEAPRLTRMAIRGLVWPFQWLGLKGDETLPPVPRALQAMGPAYIKFGQVLSTRPDVVGSGLAVELRVLQDKLPPFPVEVAKAEVEKELGRPVDALFSMFSEPVAAASIAQVHQAQLHESGDFVAVKVLRPGIERAFQRDIDTFYLIASFLDAVSPSSRRLKPLDVIEHFEGVVLGELDLRLESASASEFAANTETDKGFTLPRVRWALSARRVMTLDWAEGINAAEVEAIAAAGHDMTQLAQRVLQLFLKHALRDGFFHADMHHGNLKIAPNGDIIALDFGIMGHLDEYTRRVYAEILFGFIQRDYMRVAEVHFEAGYVPADRDVNEFARALRAVGEPIFGMNAEQISMARLLSYLFEVTERFGMETRTELILLQRTMVVVEGVARTFDPRMNIWDAAKPVVETYIADSIGPRAMIADLQRTARVLGRFGPRLPALAEAALIRLSEERDPAPRARPWPAVGWMAVGAGLATAVAAVIAGIA
ncbi:2-polyprenylphenol 6-hydroxylase [Thalassorhabdomicrobium marinisediminis]|uniref:2-polyprenylphenol 6-hydroxylase n=1 Tax=Thalassorhabdomicrobium marinisediminis TaxID=2170577 RepID=UPI0024925405|nr:2-polyprenylphenol 6-hydroxylase [Thalassorhabdomicrobium marinisediminis]